MTLQHIGCHRHKPEILELESGPPQMSLLFVNVWCVHGDAENLQKTFTSGRRDVQLGSDHNITQGKWYCPRFCSIRFFHQANWNGSTISSMLPSQMELEKFL